MLLYLCISHVIPLSGDENKKALLDLNAHEALLSLITHEERVVRRNAVMALGVMASHG